MSISPNKFFNYVTILVSLNYNLNKWLSDINIHNAETYGDHLNVKHR